MQNAKKSPQRSLEAGDASITDPQDWPLAEGALLDIAMRCSVCKGFFVDPVITRCSHSFCALCLERWLSTNNVCPTCHKPCYSPDLRRNLGIADVVTNYEAIRPVLLQRLGERVAHDGGNAPTDGRFLVPNGSAVSTDSSETVETETCELNADTLTEARWQSTASGASTLLSSSTPQLESSNVGQDRNAVRRKKPKLVYSMMKEAQLRQLLKDEGLPCHGLRDEMQRRHAEFVNRYNANVDATNPKNVQEIMLELKLWERAQRTDRKRKSMEKLMRTDLNNSDHQEKYKDHFEMLIQQAGQTVPSISKRWKSTDVHDDNGTS